MNFSISPASHVSPLFYISSLMTSLIGLVESARFNNDLHHLPAPTVFVVINNSITNNFWKYYRMVRFECVTFFCCVNNSSQLFVDRFFIYHNWNFLFLPLLLLLVMRLQHALQICATIVHQTFVGGLCCFYRFDNLCKYDVAKTPIH